MSLQNALLFIQRVAAEPELQHEVRAFGADLDLRDLVALGARLDLDFTIEELNDAFVRDWAMRRAHFTGVVESPSE